MIEKDYEVFDMRGDNMNNRETGNPALPLRDHVLTMENRQKAVISGVRDLDSFNEQEIVFAIDNGLVILAGQDLHISRLNLDDGQLVVEGLILGVEYHEEVRKNGWFSRFMK
jgi:sporulation protein YabP/spore cortex biosynthesis protein YabQ